MAIAMHGKTKALRREHNSRAWLAWHIAALQRTKKLPTLRSMLAKEKPRAQSWQEQIEIMRQYAAAHNKRLSRG
jgi:hypothetical protein